ncbi:hypothetical protein PR048_032636 [Dryococelus australis]|uniref:Uncharacterized protein n=1 Tax=Dryococelus australis TaxID=614101 RepID=A0ABQ9G2R9_9NEOP|nr:hypothetical protein PR048_032636 [Dryococelus australis]
MLLSFVADLTGENPLLPGHYRFSEVAGCLRIQRRRRRRRRNARAGDPRVNLPTSGIVRHDPHLPNSGSPWRGRGERADKIDVKHVYTEVNFAIGSQFIRHALDDCEPIADLQGSECHTARRENTTKQLVVFLTLSPRRSPRIVVLWGYLYVIIKEPGEIFGAVALEILSKHGLATLPESSPESSRTKEPHFYPFEQVWAAVAEWSDYPPPTKANRIRPPAGSLPEFLEVGIVPDDAADIPFALSLNSGSSPSSSSFLPLFHHPSLWCLSIHPARDSVVSGNQKDDIVYSRGKELLLIKRAGKNNGAKLRLWDRFGREKSIRACEALIALRTAPICIRHASFALAPRISSLAALEKIAHHWPTAFTAIPIHVPTQSLATSGRTRNSSDYLDEHCANVQVIKQHRHQATSSSSNIVIKQHRHQATSSSSNIVIITRIWRVVTCCKVSWCLLTAAHSRCTQQEPVTTVQPGETECVPTTHKRVARDP